MGWTTVDPTQAVAGLRQSLYSICAFDGEDVIGFVRVVGDGALYFFGQDLMVNPAYQGSGIGKQLIFAILKYLRENMTVDSRAAIIAASGRAEAYEKFGFVRAHPNGPAMFWEPKNRDSMNESGTPQRIDGDIVSSEENVDCKLL
ncbi:MAG: GNAT family N-acetyltransferase [Bdellovibrionales bacterium]|nr:GNAT family N-acetyltransferase [Bdellovibrionales bacterium]